jgi:hypothetical protein
MDFCAMRFLDNYTHVDIPLPIYQGLKLAAELDDRLADRDEGAVFDADTDPETLRNYQDTITQISQLLVTPLFEEGSDILSLYSTMAARCRREVRGEGEGLREDYVVAGSERLHVIVQRSRVGMPSSHHRHNGLEAKTPLSHAMVWKTESAPDVIKPGDPAIIGPGEFHSSWLVGSGAYRRYGWALVVAAGGHGQLLAAGPPAEVHTLTNRGV